MQKSNIQKIIQYSSSETQKPFVGRYHGALRKRKNMPQEKSIAAKKQYKQKKFNYKHLRFVNMGSSIQPPLAQHHVYNFHNILAINEHSILNPDCEESFMSTKFYLKKVKRVSIDKGCLLLVLQDYQHETTPISFICQRLKSMGNSALSELAEAIQHVQETLPEICTKLTKQVDEKEQELSVFLSEMSSRPFFSQYSPHLLIISSSLLELLGYDVQELAIQSIKYKSILNEFFSAENYTEIIRKHLDNINLLKDYLQGKMTLEDFCQQSLIVCSDFIYNRNNKKIKCQFFGGTSKQLTPYIQIKHLDSDQEEAVTFSEKILERKAKIDEFKESHRNQEMKVLKKLIKVPKQLDPHLKSKICSYKLLDCLIQSSVSEGAL